MSQHHAKPPPARFFPRLRCLDPDDLRSEAIDDDHDILNQFTSVTPSARPPVSLLAAPSRDGKRDRERPRKPDASPRSLLSTDPTTMTPRGRNDTASPICRRALLLRPPSPVADIPPEGVISPTAASTSIITPRIVPHNRSLLSASDVEKITKWLQSLEREEHHFSSYALYCELLFRESSAMTQGKPVPNRLQTAIAFHCLCRASSVFARHEGILHRICQDLSAAIYVNASAPHALSDRDTSALACFANQLTHYDNHSLLEQHRDDMKAELHQQALKYQDRMKLEAAHLATIQDLEARLKLKSLETVNYRNTAQEELNDRLQAILPGFQFMDQEEKQRIVMTVVDALRVHLTAETLGAIIERINDHEKDRLLHGLFEDEVTAMAERIRSDVVATSATQQNAILERSAARITRFHTLIWEHLRDHAIDVGSAAARAHPKTPLNHRDDDDLCDQDRKVLEKITEVMDELQQQKQKQAELTQQLHEAEQTLNNLRWKMNAQLTDAQAIEVRHHKEVEDMRAALTSALLPKIDQEVQTERNGVATELGGDSEDDDDCGSTSSARRRGRRGGTPEDDELICKNRSLNKQGLGLANIIECARIPSAKIRKILMKRKALTLNELHAIIVGYYQAKMLQDVQDDQGGKPRANLAQFIFDMYTLHYGLKDLAISQLVFLDASVRKHAAESARVRTFGLLVGSLQPDTHACSLQAIDFFLLILVVMFNAGIYRRGRKQSVHVAQNLKTFFGEGIFMSPNAVILKCETICTTIDLVFSFMPSDLHAIAAQLKDEMKTLSTTQFSGGVDVDTALEKIMQHWFVVYEQQIRDINSIFDAADANGDGTLDFREFSEIVRSLEPNMDRREVLAVYNRAAGDDHVIDKDEFVQAMLAQERGVILREVYQGGIGKKSIADLHQRKQLLSGSGSSSAVSTSSGGGTSSTDGSFRSTSNPTPYETLSGAMARLDREGSFASLVAAMDAMTESMNPMAAGAGDDDDPWSGSDTTRQAADGSSASGAGDASSAVEENVSFMALSRLSSWATEAKLRLGNRTKAAPSEIAIPLPSALVTASVDSAAMESIPEQEHEHEHEHVDDTFENDVNMLLERALSNAHIDPKIMRGDG